MQRNCRTQKAALFIKAQKKVQQKSQTIFFCADNMPQKVLN
jgi:hypothetical protein